MGIHIGGLYDKKISLKHNRDTVHTLQGAHRYIHTITGLSTVQLWLN